MKITDAKRISHAKALAIINKHAKLLATSARQKIDLANSHGRIIAENIKSPHPIPLHTNSAVDGYAFAYRDINQPLTIHCEIAAGDLTNYVLPKQTAARIFTGAKLPKNSDTIIMQEDAKIKNNKLIVSQKIKQGANCRQRGEDVKKNQTIIKKSKRLSATDIAALASIGKSKIAVYKKPKILLLATGNELKNIAQKNSPLKQGEVWDSNSPMLLALLEKFPVEVDVAPIARDNFAKVQRLIKAASKKYNMILTTGGASFGEQDFMLATLKKLGKCHLWQLAIKPGRPMMFGEIGKCLFLGLPGNPVAAYVCFLLYGRLTILKMCGANVGDVKRLRLPSNFSIQEKKLNRREFLRGKMVQKSNGELAVQKFASTGSGLISSLRESDGLIEIEEHVKKIAKGEYVDFIPYNFFD